MSLKKILISYFAGVFTVILLAGCIIFSNPTLLGNNSFFEVDNNNVWWADDSSKCMAEEEERAHRNPKFHYITGRTDSGVIRSVWVTEKDHYFLKDEMGRVDTISTRFLDFEPDEIDFSVLTDLSLEGTPVFLIFDNSEKMELFFDYFESEGELVNTYSISRDYAERTQRKILNSKLITIEYTGKDHKIHSIDFDVQDLWLYGVDRL